MMMNNLIGKICFVIVTFIFIPFVLFAQDEVLLPLQNNPVIKSAIYKNAQNHYNQKVAAPGDTLHLPFFDDFSTFSVWPSSERWVDSTAFVNFNFPINPPTVGVASFDGLDKEGNPYNDTNGNATGLCDELTSRYINLEFDENGLPYNPGDSISLVFYYQRKGLGDKPETNDSLVLQFYDPLNATWNNVWSASGTVSGDTIFNKVKISINDPMYRQNGFRFRFQNYGSQNGTLDLWHVDYVFLNKFLPPNYEVLTDYAYVYQGVSLLEGYSSVPWKHFTSLSSTQQQALIRNDAPLTIRNNNDGSAFPLKVSGTMYDQYGAGTQIVGGGGLNNIVIPLNTNVIPPATLNTNTFFQDPAPEQAVFTAIYDIGKTSGGQVDDFPVNDTLRHQQNFHDYYSYDDGSAELAYGINGIGAQLAYKFTTLKGDTLRAVNIFFAQSGLSVTNQIFRLAVWTGNTIPTGAPVYEKFNQTPNYIDSINGFYTYQTDPIYLPAGTWFFGFIQNNAVLLNLGLDVNTPAVPSRKLINTNGNWVASQLPGMWMIRPVFDSDPLYLSDGEELQETSILVYPTPVTDIINISYPDEILENIELSILDITGRIVYFTNTPESEINVSQFTNGLYFLNVFNNISGTNYQSKIVVAH